MKAKNAEALLGAWEDAGIWNEKDIFIEKLE